VPSTRRRRSPRRDGTDARTSRRRIDIRRGGGCAGGSPGEARSPLPRPPSVSGRTTARRRAGDSRRRDGRRRSRVVPMTTLAHPVVGGRTAEVVGLLLLGHHRRPPPPPRRSSIDLVSASLALLCVMSYIRFRGKAASKNLRSRLEKSSGSPPELFSQLLPDS